ncbi:MAG: adenylate/guanylate cyclase domain-containing protein [Cyclobacteriaceae bacterium]|nr:adenylate/guanylate cyclase domain-containing protein [Cyclobacteriaceae bacterium]
MTPERKLKVQNILIIIMVGLCFGLIYNYLFYPHSLTEFLEAGSISIILGFFVGVLEEFILRDVFRNKPFLLLSAIRALLYSLLVSVTLSLVLSIEISIVEEVSYTEALFQYLLGPLFQRDFIFSFVFIIFMLFSLQVILIVGKSNFIRLMAGLYHQPREISRIFMFVDLKNSTSIAESLSNMVFSSFIRDFYYDISDAIIMFKGEIYQYVGDEIVVVWRVKNHRSNSVKCFFKMQEIIDGKRDKYKSMYGIVPEFKAGIHGGKVVVTAVGKQKREIVYHGDVLNTASRIEGKCNELNQDLLTSEDIIKMVDVGSEFIVEKKGEIELRGKADKLNLFGIRRANKY